MLVYMELEIRLFATLRDRVGHNKISISIVEPADVRDLLAVVAETYPQLAPALPTVLIAVNRAYAGEDTPIHSGDEVAFFPPVSGGSDDNSPPTFFVVTTESRFR